MLLKIVFPYQGEDRLKFLVSSPYSSNTTLNVNYTEARASLITQLTQKFSLERGDLVIGTQSHQNQGVVVSQIDPIHNWNKDGKLGVKKDYELPPIFIYCKTSRFSPQEQEDLLEVVSNWLTNNGVTGVSVILIPSRFITI